jgi:hypothetical protein
MILDFFRILAILLLILLILFDDISLYNKSLVNKSFQFTVAFIVVVIINLDPTLGFIIALCSLVIYYKTYIKLIRNYKEDRELPSEASESSYPTFKNSELQKDLLYNPESKINAVNSNDYSELAPYVTIEKDDILNYPLKTKYISDEHLFAAQNNIVDFKSYNQEIKGMNCNGFNSKKIYSAQGLDSDNVNYTGYEESNNKYSNFK